MLSPAEINLKGDNSHMCFKGKKMAGKLIFGRIVQQRHIFSRLTPLTVASNCQQIKHFSNSQQLNVKEILEKTEGNTTVVEGQFITSPRADALLKPECTPYPDACPMCKLQLKVEYTDVLIISQFVTPDCTLLPQYITKLCKKQHLNMQRLVNRAVKAGLLQNLKSEQPSEPAYKYMKYNVYFKN